MKKLLYKDKLYDFFAEPLKLRKNQTKWLINDKSKYIKFTDCSNKEQSIIKNKIETKINLLNNFISDFKDKNYRLAKLIKNCMEIPDKSCIYYSKNNDKLVIILWGHILDNSKIKRGILKRIVPKYVKVIFDVRCKNNNLPAKNIIIDFEFYNKKISNISDDKGIIIINSIKEGTLIDANYFHKTKDVKINTFRIYEESRYLLEIDRATDIVIIIKDKTGKICTNIPVTVKYQENIKALKSNSNGQIELNNVLLGEEIKLTIEDENIITKNLVIIPKHKQNEYSIIIKGKTKIFERVNIIKNIFKNKKLKKIKARVALVLDKTGSMSAEYSTGQVQKILNKTLPIAFELNNEKKLDVWAFDSVSYRLPQANEKGYKTYIEREVMQKFNNKISGWNKETVVMRDVIKKYYEEDKTKIPVYIIFISDGGVMDDKGEDSIEFLLKNNIDKQIFWQFVGIGRSSYGILENLTTNNSDFFWYDDIEKIKDEKLYSDIINNKFTKWYKNLK